MARWAAVRDSWAACSALCACWVAFCALVTAALRRATLDWLTTWVSGSVVVLPSWAASSPSWAAVSESRATSTARSASAVSRVARVSPFATVSPTSTRTLSTVPEVSKFAATSLAGWTLPSAETVELTAPVVTATVCTVLALAPDVRSGRSRANPPAVMATTTLTPSAMLIRFRRLAAVHASSLARGAVAPL